MSEPAQGALSLTKQEATELYFTLQQGVMDADVKAAGGDKLEEGLRDRLIVLRERVYSLINR